MAKYATGDERDNLLAVIADLKRRVEALEAGSRANNTTVDAGEFNVKGGIFKVWPDATALTPTFQVGPNIGLQPLPGFAFYYPDGQFAFSLWGTDEDSQFVGMWDREGNPVVATDFNGIGLATPYLSMPGTRTAEMTTPLDSTTSASFTAFYRVQGIKQHPHVVSTIWVVNDAGTSGELRMFDVANGVVLEDQTLPSGDVNFHSFNVAIAGTHTSSITIEFQFRRTGGAGNVRAVHILSYGVAS
jgi:hypothetical protein